MTVNRKTLIMVIAGTAAVVLIALGVLWYANNPAKTKTIKNLFGVLPQLGTPGGGIGQQPATDNQQLTADNQQPAANGNETAEADLLQIVKKPVLGATLTADGANMLYYDRSGGKLESVDFSGNATEQISPLTIVGMFDVVWQDAKRRSVVSYLEEATVKRFINATATTGVMFLPEGVRSLDFSPDSRSIAYLLRTGETTQLIIANEDGKKPVIAHETPIPDFALLWIAPKKILLQSVPSNRAPGIAYVFDAGTKTLEKIFSGIRGNITIASRDGSALLTSFTGSDERLALSLTNQKGENGRAVTPATIAEKCVFTKDAKILYCAIPHNEADLPTKQQTDIPDAWLRGDVAFEDQFARISTDTLAAEIISDKTKLDAINLFLAPDEHYLFFQDKNDLTLWRLKLR